MKKLNKVIFLLTTAALLASTPFSMSTHGQVLAAEKQAKELTPEWKEKVEKAIEKAKATLPYLADFTYSELDILEKDDGTNYITITLQTSKEKKKPSFTMTLDEKGNPNSFGYEEEFPQEGRPKIEPEKLISKTTQFMKQWYGDDMGGYRYNSNYSDGDSAMFTKQVNGLPFRNDNVHLVLNSKEEVIGKGSGLFQMGEEALEDMKFTDPKDAISKKQAEEIFSKHLKLFYLKQPIIGSDDKAKKNLYGAPTLRYKSEFSQFIDAKTGKEVPNGGSGTAFNPIEKVNPEGNAVTVKTTEEAAALFAAFGIESKADKIKEGVSEDTKGKMFTYEINDDLDAEIETEEKTGLFMGFRVADKKRSWEEREEDAKKWMTRDEAKKIAIAALEKYGPKHIKEVMPLGTEGFGQRKNGQQFKFVTVHEGIPVVDDEIFIRIDLITGKVLGLHLEDVSREPLSLPDPKKAVPHEQAVKEYLKVLPLELQYFIPEDDGESEHPSYEPILAYRTAISLEHREIDALTGKFTEPRELHVSPYK